MSKEHTYVISGWVHTEVSIQIKSELEKPELLEELLWQVPKRNKKTNQVHEFGLGLWKNQHRLH